MTKKEYVPWEQPYREICPCLVDEYRTASQKTIDNQKSCKFSKFNSSFCIYSWQGISLHRVILCSNLKRIKYLLKTDGINCFDHKLGEFILIKSFKEYKELRRYNKPNKSNNN